MATKATAKEKYVGSVSSDLAIRKMTSKLSTYLGITVSESAGPIRNYREFARNAGDYFERAYDNMRAAYGG
ncbi:MAG: hypothetical protein ACOC58_00110 [Chloroflexota bacterium]